MVSNQIVVIILVSEFQATCLVFRSVVHRDWMEEAVRGEKVSAGDSVQKPGKDVGSFSTKYTPPTPHQHCADSGGHCGTWSSTETGNRTTQEDSWGGSAADVPYLGGLQLASFAPLGSGLGKVIRRSPPCGSVCRGSVWVPAPHSLSQVLPPLPL